MMLALSIVLQILSLISCAFLGLVLVRRYQSQKYGQSLPCPRGLPVLGNALQLGDTPWVPMTEWAKDLGPIYRVNLAGKTAVVLNTYKVASEILDKRSNIYSDRPRMIVTGEILCGGIAFPFLSYDCQLRRLRKAVADGLNSTAAKSYLPVHEEEALLLIDALLQDPSRWESHIERAVASSVVRISYGVPPIKSAQDPLVSQISDFTQHIERFSQPGAHVVDLIPILNLLPDWLAPWKRWGSRCHDQYSRMFLRLYKDALDRQDTGHSTPCVASLLVARSEVTEKEASWLSGILFGAGFSTTSAVLRVFVLAMVLHPEIMRKAQQQLDEVVGRSRLPMINDEARLPYVRALIKEVFRWKSIAPLGLPHRISVDDEFQGYHIPKDSIVIYNNWAMSQDEEVFEDPKEFKPERYLDQTEQVDICPESTHNSGHTSFGYGRRRCVGLHVAKNALFTTISTLLWTFDITHAKDANGRIIAPDENDFRIDGIIIAPATFPTSFELRFPGALDVIKSRMAELAPTHDL